MTGDLATDAMRRYGHRDLLTFTASALAHWGVAEARARATAELIVESDLRGIGSHGVSMLTQYEAMCADGTIDVAAEPTLVSERGAVAVMDANHGLGHPAMRDAVDRATSIASRQGIGLVTVRRSQHFGCAGVYATRAAEHGMIGLVCSTTRTRAVVPTRSGQATLGTNPIAFAAPGSDHHRPFLLDMATSATAVNKLKLHQHSGEPVPPGLVVDPHGQPVTDPDRAYAQARQQGSGGLLPLGGTEATGGHKGFGLALMVQILAGALSGSTFAPLRPADQQHDDVGHCCLVIDPSALGGDASTAIDAMTAHLRDLEPVDPGVPVLVPGDPEWTARAERSIHGIPLTEAVVQPLSALAQRAGTPFPAPLGTPR